MSDPNESGQQPPLPATGFALGGATTGGYDRSLQPDQGGEHGGAEPDAAPPTDADTLSLPRYALVAFRKSGGLRFSSRGFVVYRSGWVMPLAVTEGRPRHVTREAVAALETLLLRSAMHRVAIPQARGTRDGYSYEIVAHYGGRTRSITLEDGAIPRELRRLVDVLQRLMPHASRLTPSSATPGPVHG